MHSFESRRTWGWEDDLPIGWEGIDVDDGTDADPTAATAGIDLADCLVFLKNKGKLSARDVCVLAYYAQHAGVTGPAVQYAFRPDAPSGHFQRHLDSVLGVSGRSLQGGAR